MNKLEKRFVQQFYAKVGACIHDFELINDGDHVLVGVSGGKDSLALLQTLASRRRFVNIDYKITAVHIDVEEVPYKVDMSWLRSFCESLEVDLMVESISVDFTQTKKDSTCFYCSWNRRKRLFELTKELEIDKLALGHHRDDALETLLLNMISHGTVSSMPGKLKMFKGRVELIRPLLYLTDEETKRFASLQEYPFLERNCPYEDVTRRFEMRNLLDSLEDQFPAAKKNLYKSVSNIYLDYLPTVDKDQAIIRDLRTM